MRNGGRADEGRHGPQVLHRGPLSLFAGYIRDGAAGTLPAFNESGGGQPLKRTPGVRAGAIDELAHVLDRMVHPGVLKQRRKHLLGRWTKLGIRHGCATFTQTG